MLLVLADAADATSRLWQPRISRYDHLPAISSNHSLTRRALDELENPSPIAARSIDKRLLIRTLSLMQRWPNNEIRYCFATKDDKLALFSNLKTAINRWWEMGLDQANFKWTEVDENECESRRSSILLIKRQPPGTGAHVTTTGFVPADPSVGNFGPLMELDDGEWGGYDTKVGSFAHEIGHAWGLFHEHQNPNFWRPEDGFDQGNQGKVFGNDNFHCENIIGYETKLAAAQAQFGQENGKRICKNGVWARLMEFEAQAFLPMSTDEVYSLGGHEFGDVDWSSIMVCILTTSWFSQAGKG